MLPIMGNSRLFAFLLPLAAAQVLLPPGLPSCAYPCGNIIASPAAASCANLTSGSIHCYCTTPGIINQIAQCGTTVCPADVVNGMLESSRAAMKTRLTGLAPGAQSTDIYSKLANICSQVGGALPATITLSSTTLVLPSSTSTAATSNTAINAGNKTSTAANGAASTSGSGTAGGILVQGTGILEWTWSVMAMYFAIY